MRSVGEAKASDGKLDATTQAEIHFNSLCHIKYLLLTSGSIQSNDQGYDELPCGRRRSSCSFFNRSSGKEGPSSKSRFVPPTKEISDHALVARARHSHRRA